MKTRSLFLFAPLCHRETRLFCAAAIPGCFVAAHSTRDSSANAPCHSAILTAVDARKIVRDWITRDEASSYAGFVLPFEVDSDYLAKHAPQCTGGQKHMEYWNLAEDLSKLNQDIVGRIEVDE